MTQLVTVAPVPSFTINDMERIAMAIAKGGLFGAKDPNAVLTLCMLAQAEGQHPAVVMRDYHMISGKPAKKSEAMQRDFLASGGKIEWHALDDKTADATFSHPMGGSARIDWTLDRAKQAGLMGNAMWTKYPRQMLRSRVISEGCRTVFPAATSGMYVPEELEDVAQPPRNVTPPAAKPPQIAKAAPAFADDTVDFPGEPRDWAAYALDFQARVASAPDKASLAELREETADDRNAMRAMKPALNEACNAAYKARANELSSGDAA